MNRLRSLADWTAAPLVFGLVMLWALQVCCHMPAAAGDSMAHAAQMVHASAQHDCAHCDGTAETQALVGHDCSGALTVAVIPIPLSSHQIVITQSGSSLDSSPVAPPWPLPRVVEPAVPSNPPELAFLQFDLPAYFRGVAVHRGFALFLE